MEEMMLTSWLLPPPFTDNRSVMKRPNRNQG